MKPLLGGGAANGPFVPGPAFRCRPLSDAQAKICRSQVRTDSFLILDALDWPTHEHDVIAGAPAVGQMHGITGRLVAPR